MNARLIAYMMAVLVFCLGVFMIIPLTAAFYYGDGSAPAFLISMTVTCALGACVFLSPATVRICILATATVW